MKKIALSEKIIILYVIPLIFTIITVVAIIAIGFKIYHPYSLSELSNHIDIYINYTGIIGLLMTAAASLIDLIIKKRKAA